MRRGGYLNGRERVVVAAARRARAEDRLAYAERRDGTTRAAAAAEALLRAAEAAYVESAGRTPGKRPLRDWWLRLAEAGQDAVLPWLSVLDLAAAGDWLPDAGQSRFLDSGWGPVREATLALLAGGHAMSAFPAWPDVAVPEGVVAEARQALVSARAEYPDLRDAVLFGSRVTGQARPDSDIDVLAVSDEVKRGSGHEVRILGRVELHVFTPERARDITDMAVLESRAHGRKVVG